MTQRIDTEELARHIDRRGGALTPLTNGESASPGFRLGIIRSYGYGESRPELRPVIEGE
jgi:hypothetical protein